MRPHLLQLFPAGVAGAELRDGEIPSPLMAEERAAVARAVPQRVQEFTAGRHCAREALGSLGHARVAIPMRPTGAPAWPAGIVGSISHCRGYCGAVVAWARDVAALGFDAEVRRRVAPALWADIASEHELQALSQHPTYDLADLATLLFSAKEAYYKAHHQRHGSQLDFADVDFALVSDDTFRIEHRAIDPVAPWPSACAGRFRFDPTHVFAVVTW